MTVPVRNVVIVIIEIPAAKVIHIPVAVIINVVDFLWLVNMTVVIQIFPGINPDVPFETGVIPVHSGILMAHDDSTAIHTKITPYLRCANF